jgi:hypothetical protein
VALRRSGIRHLLPVAFRISTHAMYNYYAKIDQMFDLLVARIDASGLPQL